MVGRLMIRLPMAFLACAVLMMSAAASGMLAAQSAPAAASTPAAGSGYAQTREGFWFNVGVGYGSVGCNDCGSRTNGLAGQLALGGMTSQRWGFGVSSNGWTKQESGVKLSLGSLAGIAKFYPFPTGGFYILGGLGVGSADLGVSGYGSSRETGASAILGIGYDIRIAKNVSLTPYYNGVGISINNGDANFNQLGVSFTWH